MNFDRAEAAALQAPPPWLRDAVRELLQRAPGYAALDAPSRTALARSMVQVGTIAAELIAEERDAEAEIEHQARSAAPPLARAQEQPGFGAAADRIASTTRNVLGAVSFPRFVTDLVNGVFRAMLDSTSQQMQMYVNLLNSVSASLDGFERSQTGVAQVRQWVADKFPDQIEYDVPEVEPGETADPEDAQDVRLRLRAGASMPDAEQIRGTLGLGPDDPVQASNPEQLVPLARRTMARQRQSMLATMVQMGMQRIVIDSGRINASMRFHIDTRSVASEDRGSQFGMQNRVKAGGSFGVGAWGVNAEVENTISFVSTQRSQATEEMNTDLELNSSVELNFRTDYLPLNRMAAQAQADRIRNASLNPAAEADPAAERRARQDSQRQAEQQRREGLLTMPATQPSTTSEPPRRDAAARSGTGTTSGTTTGGTTTGGTTAGTTGGTTTGTTGGTTTGTTGGTTTGTTGGTTTGTTSGTATGTTAGRVAGTAAAATRPAAAGRSGATTGGATDASRGRGTAGGAASPAGR